jgi:hypothetical protein
MANLALPIEERNLTPSQVARLDKRRNRGFVLMVIAGQFSIIATILLLWVYQDVTYSPGWAHPVLYYFLFSVAVAGIAGLTGAYMRRGTPEF